MSRTPPLASLLLLLALRGRAVRGDCGQPPEVPNAKAELNESTFPDQSTVTYTCNEGFIKIPGKTDTVTCLADGQWSEIEDVCGRSCNVPTRLSFAALKRAYIRMNFYPVGISVEYECRPGFQRNPFLSTKSTCLPNLEWSKVDIFCSKKQCPNPGDIENGNINITSDILFGAQIFFSCKRGYKLVGVESTFCAASGKGVHWSDPFPVCSEIFCPEPPKIDNGIIDDERDTYAYGQSITYVCNRGFTLFGKSSIHCTVKDDQGEWSDLAPECRGKSEGSKVPPTVQKLTTIDYLSTDGPLTSQEPTTMNVLDTEVPSVSQNPTTDDVSDAEILLYGKFDSQGVQRNCHPCGRHSPYFWKKILSFNCLRKTIKIRCLWARKGKGRRVNALYWHVLWTPLDTRYISSYSQQCSSSKAILGQLQIVWPSSQVVLYARCLSRAF